MDAAYAEALGWIDSQRERMQRLVTEWAGINSGSHNPAGLRATAHRLRHDFAAAGIALDQIELAGGASLALTARRRPDAPVRALLGIHLDTVYGPEHPFQHVAHADADTLRGPGVADAKGGLAVMLVALDALERNPVAAGGRLGWEMLINADEEIGSPHSTPLLRQAASRCHLGLLYEPCFPDGALVSHRRGSANFTLAVRGRAAHVGRNPQDGRNAIEALADLIGALRDAAQAIPGLTFNVGRVEGGGPLNVVPDRASSAMNIRFDTPAAFDEFRGRADQALAALYLRDGITVSLEGAVTAPPKPLNAPTQRLLDELARCAEMLGTPNLQWRGTGGVCDGNRLAAAGLPTIDSLGPRGGDLHSEREHLWLPSLTERAKLSALLLMRLASGEVEPPGLAG
jgi:glutamate carboxypeptidase